MKGYNTLLGSHYDHYYIDYAEYDVDEIDPTVFQVDSGKCLSSLHKKNGSICNIVLT
jgi:hypothetical protein